MTVAYEDGQSIALPVASAFLCHRHQPLDLGGRQVFSLAADRSIGSTPRCSPNANAVNGDCSQNAHWRVFDARGGLRLLTCSTAITVGNLPRLRTLAEVIYCHGWGVAAQINSCLTQVV